MVRNCLGFDVTALMIGLLFLTVGARIGLLFLGNVVYLLGFVLTLFLP